MPYPYRHRCASFRVDTRYYHPVQFCIIDHVGANQRPRCIMSSNIRMQFSPRTGTNESPEASQVDPVKRSPQSRGTGKVLWPTFWRETWYVIVRCGKGKNHPSLVPPTRFVGTSFITVGRTSHIREEASDSSVREVGDVVHMTSAVSSEAVIQDRWHTFWSQPRVTGAMNMMSRKTGHRPGKFRSLWKANQILTVEQNQVVTNSTRRTSSRDSMCGFNGTPEWVG